MKTRDQQELDEILKSSKTDIAVMVVHLQRTHYEEVLALKTQVATLKAELAGQAKVFKLLELMAGESNLGLRV